MQTTTQTEGFEIDGKTYRTDAATLSVLRGIMPAAKATGDASAVAVVMRMGLLFGRIVETTA